MNIVVVDDHPLVRRGLIAVLDQEEDMHVIGDAPSSKEALQLLQKLSPDLVLVDLHLGSESGLDLIKRAREAGAACRFAILTSSGQREDFLSADAIGVDGYILKEALPEELVLAVKRIIQGRKYYDPGLLEYKMKSAESERLSELTPKEREVIACLGSGFSNREIAQELYITEFTVKKHVSQILSKLGLSDRTQAALLAQARGLTKLKVSV
ncbi:response regulator [Paenibacillus sp. GCM10023252]|uniref:response regulator n=1 Tax=Paenibacillus sp. GCM10023252 TaxID=3252649 RepID=UPI0036083134